MLGDPRMIWRHMIRHKIQDQLYPPLCELRSCDSEALRTSKIRVDHVTSHTIRRSDIVSGTKVRQSPPKVVEQSFILIGDCNSGWASFPNSHEPNRVKAISS